MNDYYSQLDKNISVFEGEIIQEIGKEWIKLFTIELWANSANEYCYCIPSDLDYKGTYIKKAIEISSDTHGAEGMKIKVEKSHQKEMEELQLQLMNDTYQKGLNDGHSNANLEPSDIQFQNYKNGQLHGNFILLEKVSKSLIINKYGNSKIVNEFIGKLSSQNLLI